MPRPPAALCVALMLCAPHAGAAEFAPGGDSGTLARNFALPVLGEATPLARDRVEARWTLDFTNEYVTEGACASECILLDGETARLRYAYRRGLGAGWDAGFELSWLDRGGGFLDSWIRSWHDAFGLPTGERDLAADGQYRFRYERAGAVLLDETRGGSGPGDATLTAGRRLGRSSSVRAMLKLPTGDGGALEGGNAGGAVWLERRLRLPPAWHGYAAAGVSANGRGDVLPGMQRRELAFAGVGLLAPFTPSVGLAMQLQFHGRLYERSEMAPLARPGMPLTLGLRVRTGARGALELGFQEDPSVNGSPDFAAYLSYRSLP